MVWHAPGFPRGLRPTPRHKLAASLPYRPVFTPPAQFANVPKKLSFWGNDQFGDCVTAEEAFKCACDNPEDFVTDQDVIAWASDHGFLDGADLLEVIQAMQSDGFPAGQGKLDDGQALSVDYSNEPILQSAIAQGPVKIGIDADALPSGAGNMNGWFATGGGRYTNEDHCVSLSGYGSASFLFSALGVPLPAALQPNQMGYLLFTWSTIGFVDHAWIMSTCGEAWLRSPSTVYVGPTPTPAPGDLKVNLAVQLGSLSIPITGTISPASSRSLLDNLPLSAQRASTLPPWILLMLQALCADAAILPPPWAQIAQVVCTMLPPALAGCRRVSRSKQLAALMTGPDFLAKLPS